jgi:transketolase
MTMRERFAVVASELLAEEPRLAVLLADISADMFREAAAIHPSRVVNVGIREQLMIGIAGGMALTGLRPIAHSYAPFVVDRAYEQIKLDLDHQGVGAILVSTGGSYDAPEYGRTHFSPGDVELLDTLEDWTVHVPGHEDEVESLLRAAARGDGRCYLRLSSRSNSRPRVDFETVRDGDRATVFAVGPTLDPVLEAVRDLDVRVVYLNTPRPLDPDRVRTVGESRDIVIVEPHLRGTSTRVLVEALGDARRVLALGVSRRDLHRYGTVEDHDRWHGLDPDGLRRSIAEFVGAPARTTGAALRSGGTPESA